MKKKTRHQQARPLPAMGENLARALPIAACVFISGAAVMIYEFVAVRFLQRNFGSLLDVWACEIAVCMAGLALGYWIGGVLADRYRSWKILGFVLVVAALTALPMEPLAVGMGEWMLDRPQAWWHPLVAAMSSFLPLFALGTVMPQAVRLHVRDIEGVGKATGWIAATSTCGSIAGVLLTAMVLFPNYGVVETGWGTSAVLTVFGVLILVMTATSKRWTKAAAIGLALLAFQQAHAQTEVLFEKYSTYHHILVVDTGNRRELRFDDTRQTLMYKDNPFGGGFEYAEFFHTAVLLNPSIRSALFIGLGGGTGPKSFYKDYPDMQIEVAEIDPMVIRVAHEYFSVPKDSRLRIAASDGRTHLRRSKEIYGAVFLDAYGAGRYAGAIPFHLATQEFFRIVRDHLVNGGCLVYNVMGTFQNSRRETVEGIYATLASVFEQVYAFQAASSMNTVMVAQKNVPLGETKPWPEGPCMDHPLDAEALATMVNSLAERGVLSSPALAQRMSQLSRRPGDPANGRIFTDNFSPVDVTSGLHVVE